MLLYASMVSEKTEENANPSQGISLAAVLVPSNTDTKPT